MLMPGEEDFGIAPLEAQACGCPVVALARGGAVEGIASDQTGVLVDEPAADAFAHAIRGALAARFDPDHVRRHAEQFGRRRFADAMAELVKETVREGAGRSW